MHTTRHHLKEYRFQAQEAQRLQEEKERIERDQESASQIDEGARGGAQEDRLRSPAFRGGPGVLPDLGRPHRWQGKHRQQPAVRQPSLERESIRSSTDLSYQEAVREGSFKVRDRRA